MIRTRSAKNPALALCIVAIAVLGSVGLTLPSRAGMSKERQITTDTSWQGWPDIYMDRVVWTDFRGHNMDIYYCDLATGQERRITTSPSVQRDPRIFGDIIAWTDYRNGEQPQLGGDVILHGQLDADVFYYDISTGRETRVTQPGSNQTLADVWGSWIFFYEVGESTTRLVCYDVGTGASSPVNISGRRIDDLSVFGTRLVYPEVRGPPSAGPLNTVNEDIFMYDLATGEDRRITPNPEQQTGPDIFGDNIVWSDWRNFDSDDVADNYLYGLASGQEVKLTSDRYVSYPEVSDSYVVYIEFDAPNRAGRVANDSLFAYDIRQGTELSLKVPPGTKESIEVWGSKIVWSELRDPAHGLPTVWGGYNYNADIYVIDLDSRGVGTPTGGYSTAVGPEIGPFLVGGVVVGLVLAVSVLAVRKWMR